MAAQCEFLDQFRWIAWFEIACGVLTMAAILLFFRDPVFPATRPSCGESILRRLRRRRESVTDSSSMAPKKDATQRLTPMGVLVSLLHDRVLAVTDPHAHFSILYYLHRIHRNIPKLFL